MDRNTLVAQVIGMLLFAAVACSPVACTMNRHQLIAEAIKAGVDPIAAKCAIEGDTMKEPVCLVKTR